MGTTTPTGLLPERTPEQRAVLLVGALVLFALGGLAWTYYLERTACFDSAFFSWLMIDGAMPMSVLGRYGSWLTQLLPVALINLGAPLESVLRSYSVSFIAFHALVFWVLAFKLKDRKATYALPVALTAAYHYMFYYGISELYQGLTLLLLLWPIMSRAVLADQRRAYIRWFVLAFLLSVWISFYHQLLVLPLVFILGFEFLGAERRARIRLLIMGSVMVLWFIVRIKGMATSVYEQSRMPTIADLVQYSAVWQQLESTAYLFGVWTKFHGQLLLMSAGLIIGVVQRAWLRTLWTITFTLLFMLLVLIVDRDGKAIMIYENYYPVLGLVWAIQFISLVPEHGLWPRRLRVAVLASVCALGLMQIHRGHYRITEKVAYAQRITAFWEMQGKPKVLVNQANYPWNYGVGQWPVGFETALASSVKGPHYCATLFTSGDSALLDTIGARKEQFLGPTWEPLWFSIPGVDQRYFDLPTDTGYFWATTRDTTFDLNHLVLRAPPKPFRMVADRYTVVPISIHNPTDQRMPSRTASGAPVRMGYRLFMKDGTEYARGVETTAIETDIPAGMTYHQGLVIERPPDNGTYWVLADLLVDGQPFGKYTTFDVVVDGWPF